MPVSADAGNSDMDGPLCSGYANSAGPMVAPAVKVSGVSVQRNSGTTKFDRGLNEG